MKFIFGSLYLVVLGVIFFVLFSVKKYRNSIKVNWKSIAIFTICTFIVGNALLYLFLRQESFISVWEHGGYWKKVLELNKMMDESVKGSLLYVFQSIQVEEYPYLVQLFLSTPIRILGNTFPIFVLTMYNLFLMPFNILMYAFSLLVAQDLGKDNKNVKVILGIIIGFFAANVMPMISGYVGVACLPILLSVIILLYCRVLEEKISVYSIYMGFSFLLIVLMRRWFAFTVVGFFLGCGFVYLFRWWKEKQDFKTTVLPLFINFFIAGIIPLTLLYFVFHGFFQRAVGTDYGSSFAIMASDSPLQSLMLVIEHYGYLYFGLSIFGAFHAIREEKTRYFSAVSFILVLFSLITLSSIQVMGTHHFYTVNIFMLYFICFGFYKLFSFLRKELVQRTIIVVVSAILLINTSYIFTQKQLVEVRKISNLLISTSFPELRIRDDIDIIREITNFIRHSVGDSSVYVLGSSIIFSEDIIQNSLLPYELTPISNLASSKVWDIRDGAPKQFFYYQYILISDPIQYQFDPTEQRVVGIFAEEIMYNGILTPYYDEIKSYTITGGITVKIYKRNTEIPQGVKDAISDIFKSYYPEHPYLYEFD